MPLASSRSSTGKAGEARRKAAAEQERLDRIRNGKRPSSTRGRTRSNSLSSQDDKENRTRPGHRRRDSSPGPTAYWKVAEERGGEHSPVETRSAKKKKKQRLPPSSSSQGGQVLCFSPPDQKENVEREKAEIDMRKQERDRRVSVARNDGRYLEYDKSFNLAMGTLNDNNEEVHDDQSEMSIIVTAANNDFSSPTQKSSSPQSREVLATISSGVTSIRTEMALYRKDLAEKKTERCHALEISNSDLLKSNEALTYELAELKKKVSKHEREADEALRAEVLRLQNELKRKNEHCVSLESELENDRENLRSTVNENQEALRTTRREHAIEKQRLEAETIAAQAQTAGVKQELEQTKTELTESKLKASKAEMKLELLQSNRETDQNQLKDDLIRQKTDNATLQADLAEKAGEAVQLRHMLEDSRKELQNNKAEHKSQLDEARKVFDVEKAARRDAEEAAKEQKQQLEHQIKELQKEMEGERLDFQKANESGRKEIGKLTHENDRHLQEIRSVREERAALEDELAKQRRTVASLQLSLSTLETRQNESGKETEDLRMKLTDATLKIDGGSKIAEELNAKLAGATEEIETLSTELESQKELVKNFRDDLRAGQQQINDRDKKLKDAYEERDDAVASMKASGTKQEELLSQLRESERIRRELQEKNIQLGGNMRVFTRVRPLIPGEQETESLANASKQLKGNDRKRKHSDIEEKHEVFKFPGEYDRENASDDDYRQGLIVMTDPELAGPLKNRKISHRFSFDKAFSQVDGQKEVWLAAKPMVQSAIDGYNVCLFAYGQTGSGKTHTMIGENGNEGVIPRAIDMIFNAKTNIENLSRGDSIVQIFVELLEVYNEEVRDLLSQEKRPEKRKVQVRMSEALDNIKLLAEDETDARRALELAKRQRTVKATSSNDKSSRSHLIFTLHIEVQARDGGVPRSGKLHICDLAGSERLSKSKANYHGGGVLEETKQINKSLHSLSNVIESLQSGAKHVNYRDSKLTSLLHESFGGNSKTLAIVCCNPMPSHYHESLCSLRFAQKCGKVELKAHTNFTC